MSFDYFYGPDDAEQYSFYRIPKRLITGDEFQDTSTEAKLLYGLMLDRLQLSIRNQWLDSLNRVYIIYTVEDIMADLHCGNHYLQNIFIRIFFILADKYWASSPKDADKTYKPNFFFISSIWLSHSLFSSGSAPIAVFIELRNCSGEGDA